MVKKEQVFNPFLITSYMGAEYFCDRIHETEELAGALSNGRNVTLISPRRVGKTGLIHHFFRSLTLPLPLKGHRRRNLHLRR